MQKEIHLVHDRACFSRVCVVDRFSTDWMLVVVCVRAIVAMSDACWCTNTVKSQIAGSEKKFECINGTWLACSII
jgi:hypothetical protein